MIINRQQACAIFGLTRAEFDRLVKAGLPARKKSASRGEDWAVDTVQTYRWLVEREVAETRPEPADQDEAPPTPRGLEGADRLENTADRVALVAYLLTLYALPARVAAVAVLEAGLPMDTAYKLATGIAGMVLYGAADELAGFEPWRSTGRPVEVDLEAFAAVNWPGLAEKAGEPGWRPPRFGAGWYENAAA